MQSLVRRIAFRKVQTKVENRIGFITMNNEKDFNALSAEMKAGLVGAVKDFEKSAEIKVIVLSSSVKKAFCAGANIKEF